MASKKVKIDRAPVLTLWATIVAKQTGYDQDAALTLGKAVAGLNAQSKGRRLGIYEEAKEPKEEKEATAQQSDTTMVSVLGRPVPVQHTDHGIRAVSKGKPISPASVQRYLQQRFGDQLTDVQAAMETLAKAYSTDQLAAKAYQLYEKFRPEIPEGQKGWGTAGELDLDVMRALAGSTTHQERG